MRFSELSPLVFRLLQLLAAPDGPRTARALLGALATEAGATGDAAFHDAGLAMLARLQDEGTVIHALC